MYGQNEGSRKSDDCEQVDHMQVETKAFRNDRLKDITMENDGLK